MKEVILHIGIHKTGTSSIQAGLMGYDDGTCAYVTPLGENHSISITTIFSHKKYSYGIWKNHGLSRDQIDERSNNYKKRLDTFLDQSGHQRLIISGEDIRHLPDGDKIKLVEYFQERGYRVKIYCLFRDPRSWLASAIQQLIKGGISKCTATSPDYRTSFSGFETVITENDIFIEDFDEILSVHSSPVKWFAATLGLDVTKIKDNFVNESLSEDAARILFRLNNLPIHSIGSLQNFYARKRFIRAINQKYPLNSNGKINKDLALHIMKPALRDEINEISNRFNIHYDLADVELNPKITDDYLSDLSGIDPAGIQELLAENESEMKVFDLDMALVLLFQTYRAGTTIRDQDIDHLRDIAVRIEKNAELTVEHSLSIMQIAQRGRPDGPLILKKIDEYKQKIKELSDASDDQVNSVNPSKAAP